MSQRTTPSLMSSLTTSVSAASLGWKASGPSYEGWPTSFWSDMCSKRTATTPSPWRSIASPLPAWVYGGSGTNSEPIGTPAGLPIDASPNTKVTTSASAVEPIVTSTRRSEGSWPSCGLTAHATAVDGAGASVGADVGATVG